MSNKTSDNVANIERLNNFIEAYKQTKEQSFIVDTINKDFFFEFVDCLLAEREQMLKEKQDYKQDIKDFQNALNEENLRCANYAIENNELKKRIQELENKLQDINTYILINGIDESLRTATQIRVENQHEYMIQQKINKLEEERDHWHGCFIVAMENGIAKEKVIDVIQEYKDKIEQYNEYRKQGKETDVEYYENITNTAIVQVLQELLQESENK